jgi:hypothetical protein
MDYNFELAPEEEASAICSVSSGDARPKIPFSFG